MTNSRVITSEQASKSCGYWGIMEYIETSAKDNTNIDDVFHHIATELLKKHSDLDLTNQTSGIDLNAKTRTLSSWSACCNT